MKKLILKTSLFTIPFFGIYILNITIWNIYDGDLIRLGYLYSNKYSKNEISKLFHTNKNYTNFSELNLKMKYKFDILTIGDSFSDQDSLGYQNYIDHKQYSVLNMDRNLYSDPIQRLIQLTNGNFFDNINVNYILLESVERSIVTNCNNINFNDVQTYDSINNIVPIPTPQNKPKFFSDATIKIPVINLEYLFTENPYGSMIYKFSSNRNDLFTGKPTSLLFYDGDISVINKKNDSLNIVQCNKTINILSDKLRTKGITLILLIAPDKYDMYYKYIKHKKKYAKPLFFKYLQHQKKDYIYLDSYSIISNLIKKHKDIYYYSDTHWTPITANIIGKEITKSINNIN